MTNKSMDEQAQGQTDLGMNFGYFRLCIWNENG